MKYFPFIFLLLFLSSCAIHSPKTPLQILQAPKGSKYIDIAVGYSQAKYFLDIGGLRKVTLVNDAKRRLFSFPLSAGQTFDNLTLDTKKTFLGPFTKLEVILTADVVQKDTISAFDFSDYYKEIVRAKYLKTKEYLSVNEKIICFHNSEAYYGRVLNLANYRPLIYFIDDSETLKIRKKSWNSIFKISNMEAMQKKVGFAIGDKVQAAMWNGDASRVYKISGTIIGLNWKYALIKTPNSTYPARIKDLVK